jgi:hypothetical protein
MKIKAESSITKTLSSALGRIQTLHSIPKPPPKPQNPSNPNRYNQSIKSRGITIWYRVLTARRNGSNQIRHIHLQWQNSKINTVELNRSKSRRRSTVVVVEEEEESLTMSPLMPAAGRCRRWVEFPNFAPATVHADAVLQNRQACVYGARLFVFFSMGCELLGPARQ